MRKVLNFIFNFFWVITVGISSVVTSAFTGIGYMLSIIGIPFGLQHFKFIPLVFAPAGKTVVTHYGSHPVMNTLWLLFGGGLVGCIVYLLLTVVLCITIIGIPIGLQLKKISVFYFAPFGVEIVNKDQYTSKRNTQHDFLLLGRRIVANPDVIVGQKSDGSPMSVKEYFAPLSEQYDDFLVKYRKYIKVNFICSFISILIFAIVVVLDIKMPDLFENYTMYMLFGLIFVCVVIASIASSFMSKLRGYLRYDKQYLTALINYFHDGMSGHGVKKFTIRFDMSESNSTDNIWAGIYKQFYR